MIRVSSIGVNIPNILEPKDLGSKDNFFIVKIIRDIMYKLDILPDSL